MLFQIRRSAAAVAESLVIADAKILKNNFILPVSLNIISPLVVAFCM